MLKIVVLATLMLILSTSTGVPIGVDKSKLETNTTESINSTTKHIVSSETNEDVTEKPSLGTNDVKVAQKGENAQMKMEGTKEMKNISKETNDKAKIENVVNETGSEPECKMCNKQKKENTFHFTRNMNESDVDPQLLDKERIKFDNIINLDSLTSADSSSPSYDEYMNITEDIPTSESTQKDGISILIPHNKKSVESILSPLLPSSYGYDAKGNDMNTNDSSGASSEIDQMEKENSEMPESYNDSTKNPTSNIEYNLGNPLSLGLHFPLWPLKEMLNRVESVMSLMNLTKDVKGVKNEANGTKVKTVELNGRKYVLRAKIFTPDGDNRFNVRLISLTPLEEEFKQSHRETEEHEDKIERILLGRQEEPLIDGKKDISKEEEEKKLGGKKKEEDEKKGMMPNSEKNDRKNKEKAGDDSSDSDDEEN